MSIFIFMDFEMRMWTCAEYAFVCIESDNDTPMEPWLACKICVRIRILKIARMIFNY